MVELSLVPTLRNRNVFEGNSFDPNASWAGEAYATQYDWVIGNPPWKELKASSIDVGIVLYWSG